MKLVKKLCRIIPGKFWPIYHFFSLQIAHGLPWELTGITGRQLSKGYNDVSCIHSLRLFHLPSQRSRCGEHKRCLVLWFHSFLLLICLCLSLTNVNGHLLSSSSTSAVCPLLQKPGKTKPPSRLTTLPRSVRAYNRLGLRIFQTMLLPLEWPLREIDYNAH